MATPAPSPALMRAYRCSSLGLLSGTAVRPCTRRPAAASVPAPLLFLRTLATPSSSSPARLPPRPAPVAPTAPVLAPAAANPPATTRPPPLELPPPRRAGDPDSPSAAAHLLATGKAYLAFYKTGLRYLFTNTQLVRQLPRETSTGASAATRAHLLLRQRWRHDVRRLPLFALMLLVCGELTPLVVLLVPHVVPYPCRIPRQIDTLQRRAEARRAASFAQLAAGGREEGTAAAATATASHIARSLGLVAPVWDRLGVTPPHAARAAARRLRALATDDALLRQSGGAAALEPAEVRLACVDRGLDTRGINDDVLRTLLATWLQLTATAEDHEQLLYQRMETLLTTRPEAWPAA